MRKMIAAFAAAILAFILVFFAVPAFADASETEAQTVSEFDFERAMANVREAYPDEADKLERYYSEALDAARSTGLLSSTADWCAEHSNEIMLILFGLGAFIAGILRGLDKLKYSRKKLKSERDTRETYNNTADAVNAAMKLFKNMSEYYMENTAAMRDEIFQYLNLFLIGDFGKDENGKQRTLADAVQKMMDDAKSSNEQAVKSIEEAKDTARKIISDNDQLAKDTVTAFMSFYSFLVGIWEEMDIAPKVKTYMREELNKTLEEVKRIAEKNQVDKQG